MFESLSEKLQSVFDKLGRKGRLTEEDVDLALREVRVALLEADVALPVVRDFVASRLTAAYACSGSWRSSCQRAATMASAAARNSASVKVDASSGL